MWRVRSVLLAALGAALLCGSAAAQTGQAPISFDIPAGPLADALNRSAQQSGMQILFPSELVARLHSPGVRGLLTPDEALRRLLTNTGLRFEFINPRTVTITLTGKADMDAKESAEAGRIGALAAAGDAVASSGGSAPRAGVFRRLKDLFLESGAPGDHEKRAPESGFLEDIIVSARKRNESLAQVPASITVFTADALARYDIQSFNDYATLTPNVSFTYGSGPTGIAEARTVAIRGITGQNLNGTAGATGFYIDDTPVPGSVDPRVLDLENIEVLKGPQGTLFGEGSLGGNVRLITKKPDLTQDGIGYMMQAGATSGGGSADDGGDVIGNLVLVPNTLAMRVVVFANHDAGYLTRTFPTDPSSPAVTNSFLTVPRTRVGNQGAVGTFGGSLSALLAAPERLEIRLRVMYQNTGDNGFPATFAPLPSFTPAYTLDRAFDVQSRANDVWSLPSVDLYYRGNRWSFVSSTSYFYRRTQDVEDSTYGTQQIMTVYYGVCCLPPQPYLWRGEHYHDQLSEEMRVSFDSWHNLSGTVGAYFSNTRTQFSIPPIAANGLVAATANNTVVGPWPNDILWFSNSFLRQKDTSLFGEIYYKFLDKLTLTLGARQYWLSQDSSTNSGGFQDFTELYVNPLTTNSQSGLNPKVGLSYQRNDEVMMYASASKGFRAGGAQRASPCSEPDLPLTAVTHLRSDTLWSYEAGAKVQLPHPGLLISAAAFHINWKNPQQELALPCGAYFDINGQAATINGGEFDISGHVTPSFDVRLGAGYEKTDVTEPGALAYAGIEPGSRIPGTPAWNVSLGGTYTRAIGEDMQGFLSADYSYTGNSLSLINGGAGAELTRPGYSLSNLRIGLDRGQNEVSLNIRNLGNAKPNLGDIGYVGYAQYGAAGAVVPQVATLQPLSVLLQYRKSF